jgi:hypothetical protein
MSAKLYTELVEVKLRGMRAPSRFKFLFSSQCATQFIRFSECLKKGPGGLGIAYGMDLNIRFFEQFCGPPIGAHGF